MPAENCYIYSYTHTQTHTHAHTHAHTHTHTRAHTRPLISSLMLLISIMTSPRYWYTGIQHARAATGGTAPGRADGSHSGVSEEEIRWRSEVWLCGGCWWVCGGVGKHQEELASERRASWQTYGLLITHGLPPP